MITFLQRLGKSLMLPVATLPAAAILWRFGSIDYMKEIPLGTFGVFLNHYIAPFLKAGGGAIFDNLPIIFAVGVAIGLAKDAVAALAAVIAYLILSTILKSVPMIMPFIEDDVKLDMGVIGGIMAGGIAAYLYKKYYNIQLPDWLGFFGGKRFVPIITSLVMVLVAIGLGVIWGPIQDVISATGTQIVSWGAVGAGLFGFINRMLVPFGLHHVINTIAWFQIGDFVDATGKVFHGDLHRFFAGDPTAGLFMTGFFPIFLFALPGAALAIIHTAKSEKRQTVSAIFLGTAFTSFLTGITEPIEFSFMFLAPFLYFVHAVLTGLSFFIVSSMGIKLGFGFSAGFIDYALNYNLATKPLQIIPIGVFFALIYYFLFRYLITKLNLQTPGREDEEENAKSVVRGDTEERIAKIVHYLGGKDNIQDLDACITRLRLVLQDDNQVDEKGLKRLGAVGVIKLGQGSVQVVFGTQSERIKDEILQRFYS